MLKSLADPRHHYSKFSTGNRFTLPAAGKDAAGKDAASEPGGDNASLLSDILAEIGDGERAAAVDEAELVRAALLAFHEFHYRPENMSAVVVGPQSLDELESWAAPLLGRIPDRAKKDEGVDAAGEDEGAVGERQQRTRRAVAREVEEAAKDAPPVSARAAVAPDPAFRPDLQGGTWPVVVTAKPLKAVRKLEMLFPLPPTWRALDRSPIGLLSHLFGHEGPGSPFAALQDKGLVTSLSAGNRVSGPDQALFKIGTTLTAEGEARWKEVVQHIFDYGSLVRRTAERSLKATGDAEADTSDASVDELRRIWGKFVAIHCRHVHFAAAHFAVPNAAGNRRGGSAQQDSLPPDQPGRRVPLRSGGGPEHLGSRDLGVPLHRQSPARDARQPSLGRNAGVLRADRSVELRDREEQRGRVRGDGIAIPLRRGERRRAVRIRPAEGEVVRCGVLCGAGGQGRHHALGDAHRPGRPALAYA